MIPYGHQHITDDDIDAVVAVLRSDFLTQGPVIPNFESAVADYCGSRHAVAVNSATSALHIACLVLGLGPGDRLWTSPITFVASANCALYCGAQVDFVDVDPVSYNLSVPALKRKLESASINGRLPKIVVPVHFAGEPCDLEGIRALADEYGFRIIEDASHAIGASYASFPVGGCRYSDITVFSFHPVKIITTGEGGMAITNDASLASHMARLRTHGVTRNPQEMLGIPEGPWYYEQIDLGYNYRMTELQAALGLSQLRRLDEYIAARHAIAAHYDSELCALPLLLPTRNPRHRSALHLYPIQVRKDARRDRAQIFAFLREAGVGVNVHYIPVYKQPFHAHANFEVHDFPEAEKYYRRAISLPIYPGLRKDQQNHIIGILRAALV
jgi:UDP-4-amino-4,6-dideoxy-N-acetyl-beta-L-altrosamine transaminase